MINLRHELGFCYLCICHVYICRVSALLSTLSHHCFPTRKVKRVGLRTAPVHKCRQCGRVHHRQTTGDEASKQQEPRTAYEHHIPLIPRQGVCMRILSGDSRCETQQ
jgi:hypothetical protein